MKIAFISSARNIHTIRWANAMSLRGHEVFVLSCAGDMPEDQKFYDNKIRLIELKYQAPLGYYLNARKVKKLVKKEAFDIVNVHYASGYGTLGRMARLKHALLNLWGSDVYLFPYSGRLQLSVIKKNLKYYQYIASTSYCMAEQARKFVKRDDIYITPFGVDTNLFKPISGLKDPDIILFGTVKALEKIYGIEDTVNAFIKLIHRLQREGKTELASKLRYHIYGKGDQKVALQSLIDENGMTDIIKLCGYVKNNELPNVLNQFTVFCCTSHSESFGVAAVEAMACGIPVLVSDAEGFVEVVENNVSGLIVPKHNIDAITDGMYQLLMDKDLRDSFGAAGIQRAKKYYEWDQNVQNMLEIYKKVSEDKQRQKE